MSNMAARGRVTNSLDSSLADILTLRFSSPFPRSLQVPAPSHAAPIIHLNWQKKLHSISPCATGLLSSMHF